MDWIKYIIDLFLNLDEHLGNIIRDYGAWTYLLLFLIIFCETGLVITPFLPGDSLLFAAGAFTAGQDPPLDVTTLLALLIVAAILGDTVNYWIGAYIGPRAFTGKVRFLKKEYLDRTREFYVRHGGKTIILARFIPIIRTFAPFVAGIGAMHYGKFLAYNVIGGIAWVVIFVLAGHFFAGHPLVKDRFHWVIVAIIVISVLPIVYEYLRARYARRRGPPPDATPLEETLPELPPADAEQIAVPADEMR
ncbi:MAG: DedA family protein [Planctomycetota bacterium]